MSQKTEFVISAKDETQAAFNSVNASLSKISGSSVNLVNSFKGIGLAAAGLAGVSSLAAFKGQIDTAIEAMGGLKDAAEKTGASVENLSALKGVAKIGGRDFAAIEGSIIKLNKALHGTDDESKGAGKAIAAIGLDLQKLRTMDPAEAFVEIARAQEKFADGGGKSAALMAILGKSAAEMIPYMHDLAEQQQLVGKVTTEQAKSADEYDKNVKRLTASWGALSRQLAAAIVGPAKDVTDWMVKAQREGGVLMGVLTGIGMAMAKAVGVEINPLARAEGQVNDLFKTLGEKRKLLETQRSGNNFVGNFFADRTANDIKEIEGKLKSAIALKNKLVSKDAADNEPKSKALDSQTFGSSPKEPKGSKASKEADPAASLIDRLDKQIAVRALDISTTEKLTAAEKEAAEVQAQVDSGVIKTTASQRELIKGKLEFLVAADKEIQAQEAYNAALKTAEDAMTSQRQKMIESIATAERQAEVYGLTESQLSAVTQSRLEDALAMAEANGASEDTIKYLQEELRLRGELTDALIKVDKKRIEQQGAAAEQTNEFAQQAARNIQSTMADFIFDPFSEGADKMAAKFGKTLQRMGADIAAAELGKLLFGSLGSAGGGKSGDTGLVGSGLSWLAGLMGSGSTAAATTSLSTRLLGFANGGIMTPSGSLPLNKYAMGGVANSPQLAMFGEGRMPEAYVPLPDGRTIPVNVKGSGGGMTINQTIHAGQGTDAAQVRRSAAAGARSALGIMNGARRYG